MSSSTHQANNLVSSSFHFHNFDPKANEEKKRMNREILAKNTHNGMAFKHSKYMSNSIQHSNNNQGSVSPSSPVSYNTSRSNSSSNKSANTSNYNLRTKTTQQHVESISNRRPNRNCEKVIVEQAEWQLIKQSIESRNRNFSNCSDSSILSKSSCNIDRNSQTCEYSKDLVINNSPSSSIRNTSSNYQVYPHSHLVHNQNATFTNMPKNNETSNITSQQSFNEIPPTSSQLTFNAPFNRSLPTQRLPSIHHLLSIPCSRIEKPKICQIDQVFKPVSIIELLKQ